MKDIESLKRELEQAELRSAEADAAEKAIREKLALAVADSVGVRIGSIVSTTRKEGFGPKCRSVTRRYEVCRIEHSGYGNPPLRLHGFTLKKDGTKGERHEIWQTWKLEEAAK